MTHWKEIRQYLIDQYEQVNDHLKDVRETVLYNPDYHIVKEKVDCEVIEKYLMFLINNLDSKCK